MKSKIFNNIGLRLIVPPIIGFAVSAVSYLLIVFTWGVVETAAGFLATTIAGILAMAVLMVVGYSYAHGVMLMTKFIQGNKFLAVFPLVIMAFYQFWTIYSVATFHLDMGIPIGCSYAIRMIGMIILMIFFFLGMDIHVFRNNDKQEVEKQLPEEKDNAADKEVVAQEELEDS